MDIYKFVFNRLEENTMIVSGAAGRCVIVDPGCLEKEERSAVLEKLSRKGLTPEAILVTHGHIDHTYGVAELQRLFSIPVYMSAEDIPIMEYYQRISKFGIRTPDISFTVTPVSDGDKISAGGLEFQVITTPGHSPGGVCYYERSQKALFTGDTLFRGTIGRTDLEGGDYDSLITSIMEKLLLLDPDVTVYPGHGSTTTIGEERMANPFLEPFNEREEIPELNPDNYV